MISSLYLSLGLVLVLVFHSDKYLKKSQGNISKSFNIFFLDTNKFKLIKQRYETHTWCCWVGIWWLSMIRACNMKRVKSKYQIFFTDMTITEDESVKVLTWNSIHSTLQLREKAYKRGTGRNCRLRLFIVGSVIWERVIPVRATNKGSIDDIWIRPGAPIPWIESLHTSNYGVENELGSNGSTPVVYVDRILWSISNQVAHRLGIFTKNVISLYKKNSALLTLFGTIESTEKKDERDMNLWLSKVEKLLRLNLAIWASEFGICRSEIVGVNC